jgi:F0F1-type ATP synthase assembly protein I
VRLICANRDIRLRLAAANSHMDNRRWKSVRAKGRASYVLRSIVETLLLGIGISVITRLTGTPLSLVVQIGLVIGVCVPLGVLSGLAGWAVNERRFRRSGQREVGPL